MARKKGALSSPFVPAEKQPYQIPDNWSWIKIGSLSSLHRGVSYKKEDAHSIKEDDDCLIMRGGNIGEGYITTEADNVYVNKSLVDKSQFVRQNDIIIVASTGSTKVIGRAGISVMDYEDVSFGAFLMLVRPIDKSNPKYLDYFFQSDDYRNQIRNLASGVNINNIRGDYITDMPIPVPPLAEQQRIVACIESLFAKLDEAKEKAQAVVDGFELRKSAILHKAFTGELTERWRKEHGKRLDSWRTVPFNDCIQKMQNGLAKRSGNIGESYVVLRLANLSEDGFNISDLREILLDEKEQETYTLLDNDVIMVRVNGSKDIVGRQLLVPNMKKWAFCDHIIRIRYQNNILPNYMVLFSKSDVYRTYVKDHMVSSAGQNTISRKGMAGMVVPIPENDEQREIVHILNNLFSKEEHVKSAAETVLEQIDTMKKAILARAFRGELGTNDPAEEWAGELVKAVL